MRRTLPEERNKKKTAPKKKAPAKKKVVKKKTSPKKKTTKKKVSKKEAIESKMPPINAKAAKEKVTYADGTTTTYGKFLKHFEARVRYIMSFRNIKLDMVEKIVYINSSIAGLTLKGGRKTFLSIGWSAEEETGNEK